MTTPQSQFTAALLDASIPVPEGLINPDGTPAQKRFDVYRNNVAVSLTDALGQAFPIIKKLVGEQNFHSLAGVFFRTHPPKDPMIALYGRQMPDFLEQFEPARALPYLPDIARLELAMRESYHAADSTAADLTPLQTSDAARLMRMRFTLAPALRLIRSDWPIHAIWRLNTEEHAPKVQMEAQDVLITRPEFDPAPHLLPTGGGAFVHALSKGARLQTALEKANHDAFDLSAALGLLISGHAITAIHPE